MNTHTHTHTHTCCIDGPCCAQVSGEGKGVCDEGGAEIGWSSTPLCPTNAQPPLQFPKESQRKSASGRRFSGTF